MSREEDIVHETSDGKFYVYRVKKGDYEVRENGATHAVKRGTFYFSKDDAMARERAIQHADKLAREKDYRHNPRKRRSKRNGSLRGSKEQIKAGIRGIRSMMRGLKPSSERYKNLLARLKAYQYSLVKGYRKTRRNDGEAPARKAPWKTILGVGAAAFALYYILRRRAAAAPALPTFQAPTRTTPINSSVAPRIGQRSADAIKMLTDYRVPFRIVRQDGRAFAVTKDYNPNRWNLTINRGILVAATKG